MTPDTSLQAQARTRLQSVRQQLLEARRAITEHERALGELRARLPELEFEEAAMTYIVQGVAPVPGSAAPRHKLTRPELIAQLQTLMAAAPSWEVGQLHAELEQQGVELGANARNYLCGVLSRNKDVIFRNLGKGCWGLADPAAAT